MKLLASFLLPLHLFAGEFAKSVFLQMSLEEKVGQLFAIPIKSELGQEHLEAVKELCEKYHFGNVIVKSTTILSHIESVNFAKCLMRGFPLVLMDAEWGLGMRLNDAMSFSKNGLLESDSHLYEYGKEMGRQLKLVGGHIMLGPVLDTNVCSFLKLRSFGSNQKQVQQMN